MCDKNTSNNYKPSTTGRSQYWYPDISLSTHTNFDMTEPIIILMYLQKELLLLTRNHSKQMSVTADVKGKKTVLPIK